MGCVRQDEGHEVPREDPDPAEACGEPVDGRVEVAIGCRFAVERDRGAVPEFLGGTPKQLVDGNFRIVD